LSSLFRLLGNLLGGKDIPIGPGDCISLNAQNLPGDPINITLKEDNVSWRAGIDFKPSNYHDSALRQHLARLQGRCVPGDHRRDAGGVLAGTAGIGDLV